MVELQNGVITSDLCHHIFHLICQ